MYLRRTILAALAAAPPLSCRAAAVPYADLTYHDGTLSWPGGSAPAACGKAGVHAGKREGDHASPAGRFRLLYGFYRADRVRWPRTELPLTPLRPEFGWVDDPADRNYNRLVALPYPVSHEKLWREDGLYDVIVVIGYNVDPVVPGAGSAIFLHVARPDLAPTEGCIAVGRGALLTLLGLLGPGSTITILT
jgi:L,D-peptidoglycan transpeptidase YkuD (ErfK/YbiS/YcfS/YnhG family)